MTIQIAVPRETSQDESRVALIPVVVERLTRLGATVRMEHDAGVLSGAPDEAYQGVEFTDDRTAMLANADIVLSVQPLPEADLKAMKPGAVQIGFQAPHQGDERIRAALEKSLTLLSVELIPRITRAQAMDALSSQASIAGYKAALIGATESPRFFPMMTTAAGTIRPAKVLIIGAGVAGLQAIATARRLGAIVEAYDVRAETREQVESLGARFVDTGVSASGQGGYARELTDEERAKQQAALAKHVAAADVVITTAAIPGRPAPKILSQAHVESMKPGAVIIDMAAETGGNCELTRAGEHVIHQGVKVVGPLNLPSTLPVHASEMYSRNLQHFLELIVAEGALKFDWEDPILQGAVVTHAGEIRHEPTRQRLTGAGS